MHDTACLEYASRLLKKAPTHSAMAELVKAAVYRNEQWRGRECINLVAAESPTSPAVRSLLANEIGTRASGGDIGPDNRFFSGMKYIDEVESLCVELLKKAFSARYADHRLMGGMAAVLTAYSAMTKPGDAIMTAPIIRGGDSSNRADGPPGVIGLTIHDIPFHHQSSDIDLDRFRTTARKLQPEIVGLGMTLSLFPLPIAELKSIITEWGGKLYFDAAHQLGLICSGFFQDPLAEGADVMTGSSGKTFSGPQGGIILWNDDLLAESIAETIFPTLTGSHQINRVAAMAIATTEMLEYGTSYMEQVVKNARCLAKHLEDNGVLTFYRDRGYTTTHQIIIDSKPATSGREVAQNLEQANIITNEMPLPWDKYYEVPTGIRLGTVEVTRKGMREPEMQWIAEQISNVMLNKKNPLMVARDVSDFMKNYRTVYYCHENGLPS